MCLSRTHVVDVDDTFRVNAQTVEVLANQAHLHVGNAPNVDATNLARRFGGREGDCGYARFGEEGVARGFDVCPGGRARKMKALAVRFATIPRYRVQAAAFCSGWVEAAAEAYEAVGALGATVTEDRRDSGRGPGAGTGAGTLGMPDTPFERGNARLGHALVGGERGNDGGEVLHLALKLGDSRGQGKRVDYGFLEGRRYGGTAKRECGSGRFSAKSLWIG